MHDRTVTVTPAWSARRQYYPGLRLIVLPVFPTLPPRRPARVPVHLRRPLQVRRALYPDDERGPSPADTRRVVIDGGELLCGYYHVCTRKRTLGCAA